MTHDQAVARAERHGWVRSTLFGARINTTLFRHDRAGRKYAISVNRLSGAVYGAHAQAGR